MEELILVLIAVITISLIVIKAFFPEILIWLHRTFRRKEKTIINDDIDEDLNEILTNLGYSYDYYQDIFYSKKDAWQRELGYTRIYDEAAALMSMIIDCEPIYFEYDNRRWLIEFWKGQYGMTTGCEIGVYETSAFGIVMDYAEDIFYYCAGDDDLLKMSFVLKKNGKKILKRSGVHWWLTGFKLGEFSEPKELSMSIKITLKDSLMREAFINGLKEAGYENDEIVTINNTVRLYFDTPKTPQPYSRNAVLDFIMQSNNRTLCEEFNDLTKDYDNSISKLKYLRVAAPELLSELNKWGKNRNLFSYSNY